MKSELVKSVKPESYYPALFEKDGTIVLFEDDDCGTVVVGNGCFPLGSSLELNASHWQRLPSGSQVILTQD